MLLFLGYAFGVAFFCSVCLFSASLSPTVASLVWFSCGPPSLVVPVFMCRVSFFLWRRSCVFFLSSCWVWGRLLLSFFWCDCSAFFLGHLRFSAVCHAAGYPSRVPHLADSGWLTYSCSGRLAWGWRCLVTPLGFLPCASAAPPSAASP